MIDFPNNPTNGQIFYDNNGNAWTYDVDQWVSSSGQIETIGQFDDVEITNLQTSDGLSWNGAKFINKQLPASLPSEQNKNNTTPKYLFSAIQSSQIILVDGVITKINNDRVSFDLDGVYDANTYTFTAPVDGHYMITACVQARHRSTLVTLYLYVNNVKSHLMGSVNDGGITMGDNKTIRNTKLIELSANDTVDVRVSMLLVSSGIPHYDISPTPDSEFSGYLFRKI
ncbi:hypothetical protein GQ473_00060 [archaeon]|nr:hypothetical protein [archaeon]